MNHPQPGPDPSPPSVQRRSPILRCVRWLFSWRGVRRMLIVLAWMITLFVLLHAEENWRGRRAWNQCRRDLEARGKQLDFKALLPKPVPEEQNFAAAPFVQSWFAKGGGPETAWGDGWGRAASMVPNQDGGSGKRRGVRRFTDLPAWQLALEAVRSDSSEGKQRFRTDPLDREARTKAAPAVLEGLKPGEAILSELREASRKQSVLYPVVYNRPDPWSILLPHLAQVKATVQRLQLRTCAELAAGKSEEALADVKLGWFLADTLKSEPFLISYLVRIACLQIVVQPIWEGLADHRWSDAQLIELQAQLQDYDLLADAQPPLDTERAAALLTVDLVGQRKNFSELSTGYFGSRGNPLFRLIPNGWLDLEKYNYCRTLDLVLSGTVDLAAKRVSPAQIQANDHELERQVAGGRIGGSLGKMASAILRHQMIANALLPALGKLTSKAAMCQTACDQANIACGLERFRLANARFPESLEKLAPRFCPSLPNDPITGKPYLYHQTSDGRFVLYSVGWNMADDGGAPGQRLFDQDQADWVWEYPEQ